MNQFPFYNIISNNDIRKKSDICKKNLDLHGVDVCGKCVTDVPCAYIAPYTPIRENDQFTGRFPRYNLLFQNFRIITLNQIIAPSALAHSNILATRSAVRYFVS